MSDPFSAAVTEVLRQYAPDIKGSRVIVALSGGADSVALCHFLTVHAQKLGITVEAAHLNHGLRGAESDAEEVFVRSFCERLELPLVCGRLSPDGHPSEAWLRKKRYEFLWSAAKEGFLATAHTMTDSCETLLLHVARGTRLGGLRGIPARSGRLIRPLIGLQRTQVEAYCAENGLEYVNDSSNAQDVYARNRLRHAAMPAMRSVNPAAERAMASMMQEMRDLHAYLDTQADALFACAQRNEECQEWDAAVLSAAPDVVLRHALNRLLSPYGDSSAARIALATECIRSGGAVEWCAGVRLCCRNGTVKLSFSKGESVLVRSFSTAAKPGVYHCAPDTTVEIVCKVWEESLSGCDKKENNEKKSKIHKKDLNNQLDYAKITEMLSSESGGENAVPVLRFRQPGDRYRPARGCGDKSLKKWLNEIGCPPALRGRLPLIAVGNRVLWLAGSGAAEGFLPDGVSHTVWEVSWQTEDVEEVE
ncbi:MAG: tRNA lysidine(34) synthetase TilS [Oscillospiraceae bacterium]|nr:tRNA lysidine(34) synthetase TilS [Oscillospiraceae bacterium]